MTRRIAGLIVLGIGLLCFIAIRVRLFTGYVPNPDIAGIFYNADLLLEGGLPYRDSAEIKPPGAFFLVATCFATFGRELGVLQWFYGGWLLVGAPAIWIAADRRDDVFAPAVATAVYLFYVGQFTYNYSGWMVPAYAWGVAGILRSLDTGRSGWAVLAGVAAALATVTIQRAGVLGPLALVWWWLARRDGKPGARPWVLGAWLGGAAIVALPLMGLYAYAGQLGLLMRAVFPLGVATDYAGSTGAAGVRLPWWVLRQGAGVFPLGVGFVLASTLARAAARRDGQHVALVDPSAALLLLASVLGAGMGGARYYMHYLVQYVPAFALFAGDAVSFDVARLAWRRRRASLAALSTAVALCCAAVAVADVLRGRADRYEGRPRVDPRGWTAARIAGTSIRRATGPDDRVFVWGWQGWPTYYWAGRRAPGRVYKPLGTLTTFNSNTAFVPSRPLHFRPGPDADAFVRAFDANPPAYVVVVEASFAPGRGPLFEFVELEQRLQSRYILERRIDELLLFRRKDAGAALKLR